MEVAGRIGSGAFVQANFLDALRDIYSTAEIFPGWEQHKGNAAAMFLVKSETFSPRKA